MKIFKILILALFLLSLTACETMHTWFSSDDQTYYPSAEPIQTEHDTPNPYSQPSEPKEYYPLPGIVTGGAALTPNATSTNTNSDTNTKTDNTVSDGNPKPGVINNGTNNKTNSIDNNARVKIETDSDKTLQ